MDTKNLGAFVARKLQREYLRTRKEINQLLKRRIAPIDAKAAIKEAMLRLTIRQSRIIALYTARAFMGGKKDAENELKGLIQAAAPIPSISDPILGKVTRANIGAIGKYNINLSKQCIKQYDMLLSDNKLLTSLNKHGYTPWLGETLKARGIDPKVISLIKDQTTSNKMLRILNEQGLRGGLHPNQVGRRLIPHVNRYFGPGGVEIDNVGKTVKRIHVDADGNYEYRNHTITRKYKATTKTYSRAIAQNSMKQAHQDAYYQSLQATNLVDHYISVSVLDSRTCGICASMHGRAVSKGSGPQYHSRCHCDLKPVFKQDGLLGDKNRPESYYQNQRDKHFLAVDDLKRYNMHLPTGSKLKHYTMLPQSARTTVMPGAIKMGAIRDRMLGMPPKITPVGEKPKPPLDAKQAERVFDEKDWGMTDNEWKAEADKLWVKTKKDGNEHLKLFNDTTKEFTGTKTGVTYTAPKHPHSSMHTHPGWDSPLSPQDISNFMSIPTEKFSAATSNNAIYIIRKKPGSRTFHYQHEIDTFIREMKAERKRLIGLVAPGHFPNQTEISLKAGKFMCKKHRIEYKVIKRGP